MRNLTVNKDNKLVKSAGDINAFEEAYSIKLPSELSEFLLIYEGLYLDEDESYYGEGSNLFEVNKILFLRKKDGLASIEAILEGHQEANILGFIPFAIDSGGWDFNVSINNDTYGQVWVNKFDSGEKETMEFVAPSFESFINGLQPEDE